MPGSRKGERRGGAKPGHIRKTPKVPKKPGKPGRPRGAPNKSKFDPELGVILNKRMPALAREQELEMYFTVTGRRMRLPREVMLDAMRYFEETAIEYGEVLRANMQAAAGADSKEAREIYGKAVASAENLLRENLTMAVDVAYKVAPYLHPRLAAFITKPGDDSSPASMLALLMKDLDEAGRPARYIDHDANEVSK